MSLLMKMDKSRAMVQQKCYREYIKLELQKYDVQRNLWHINCTFFVAISSASRASTRQTAAFSNSSFSYGISDGFAWRVLTFSSSSPNLFKTRVRSSASVNVGVGEGQQSSSLELSSKLNSWAFGFWSADASGSFFVMRQARDRRSMNRVMKKVIRTVIICTCRPCGTFLESPAESNPEFENFISDLSLLILGNFYPIFSPIEDLLIAESIFLFSFES